MPQGHDQAYAPLALGCWYDAPLFPILSVTTGAWRSLCFDLEVNK
jgi:hypothetical protein